MKEGVIILGHGSRREEANQEIEEIVKELQKEDIKRLYQVGFLQFGSPLLTEAIRNLINKDIQKVIIVPLFLTVGKHLYEDIPQTISKLKNSYPYIQFILTRHIGLDPKLIELIKNRINNVNSNYY